LGRVNPALVLGRLGQERFGEDQVRAIVALGGSEICGVVFDRTNQVRKLFFWYVHGEGLFKTIEPPVIWRLGQE
jgi:hypothetical protein